MRALARTIPFPISRTVTGESVSGVATGGGGPYVQANALEFNGSTGYLSRADAAAHDFSTALTISFWLKSSSTQYGNYVSKWDTAISKVAWGCYSEEFAGNNELIGAMVSSSGAFGTHNQQRSSVTFRDGSWHHFVYVFDGTGPTYKIYKDRVLDSSATQPAGNMPTTIYNSDIGVHVGAEPANSIISYFYSGRMTNLLLAPIALDQTDINGLASTGKPADLTLHPKYSQFTSWYKMGDGDTTGANGIIDTKGGLHLSVTGGVTIVSDAV